MTSQPGKQTIIIHLFPGFELAYCDLGNTIDCQFFTSQFFLPSQKIMIPKHVKKE